MPILQRRAERGFTLLEVMVAGSIALAIIFSLFTAVKQAGDQTVYVDKKRDERTLLADMKYILANPILCKDRLNLKKEWAVGEEIQLGLMPGLSVGKGTKLPVYGINVDSLKVLDQVQVSEDRTYAAKPNCTGATTEHYETQQGKLVRKFPKPDAPTCFGDLLKYDKLYYADLGIQTTALNAKQIKFRPELLGRIEIRRKLDETEPNEQTSCQIEAGGSNAALNVAPLGFSDRIQAMTGGPAGAMAGGSAARPGGSGGAAPAGAGGSNGWVDIRSTMQALRAPPSTGPTPGFRFDDREPASIAMAEPPSETEYVPKAPPAQPAPARDPGPEAAAKHFEGEGYCAVNMSPREAMQRGLPVVKPGGFMEFPLDNCMAKLMVCWEGQLTDTGKAPYKRTRCDTTASLSGEEMARQLTIRMPAEVKKDCAVNVTLAEARERGLPTFKTGERARFDSGDCEEKEFVCWDGTMVDAGRPPIRKAGCARDSTPLANK